MNVNIIFNNLEIYELPWKIDNINIKYHTQCPIHPSKTNSTPNQHQYFKIKYHILHIFLPMIFLYIHHTLPSWHFLLYTPTNTQRYRSTHTPHPDYCCNFNCNLRSL